MSDGNFNRNLLPYKNYQSGLRAGKMQMKVRAVAALRACLEELSIAIDDEERDKLMRKFQETLSE